MTTVTLEPLVPPPHSVIWSRARIEESATADGPWTVLETQTLSPADTDASEPQTRTLTTALATLTNGWYRVWWLDASTGIAGPTDPQENDVGEFTDERPTVAEVAALVRARTKVRGGAEVGTFNDVGPPDGTRPTASEVQELINDAVDEVLGKVQPIDPTLPPGSAYNAPGSAYGRRIRGAVKQYAAILIELSYFPEQAHSGQSPVAIFQQLYDERIRALIAEGETGQAQGMGEGVGGAGDAPADCAYAFPTAAPGALVGWASRWLYDPALFEDWDRRR